MNPKSLFLAGFLAAGTASAMDVNIDIKNIGQAAHDFAVILEGTETVTGTYDGYAGQQFTKVTKVQVGGDTLIHWELPVQGTIKDGEIFHIGWTTTDHNSKIKDMYFTNKFGQRLNCNSVLVVGGHFSPIRGGIRFVNDFALADAAIDVRNVRAAVLDRPLPLAELNPSNVALMERAQVIADGFSVRSGEAVDVMLHQVPTDGQAVVLIYENSAPGTSGPGTSFVQLTAGVDQPTTAPVRSVRTLTATKR